ncbi:uncharacterized protein LOC108863702 [Galendromus occidentalis]|uniref:Uncharacterized protein LOC108863702 n=1 Tax=Galendromus occidentalis TaxID=34638 RepID=A0AAJ7L2E8_9ACAR|nr:uncharacterized protein LOC108863702 [Galendromus occidentalis]
MTTVIENHSTARVVLPKGMFIAEASPLQEEFTIAALGGNSAQNLETQSERKISPSHHAEEEIENAIEKSLLEGERRKIKNIIAEFPLLIPKKDDPPRQTHLVQACDQYRKPCAGEESLRETILRLETAAPFTVCGVDYAGPISYKQGDNSLRKSYIILYVCPASRAIHLELVPDMSAYEFLLSLKRSLARFGGVSRTISANGLSFVRAAKELKIFYDHIRSPAVQQDLVNAEIVWEFISPHAPTHGAWWERMVQTVKRPLRKILENLFVNLIKGTNAQSLIRMKKRTEYERLFKTIDQTEWKFEGSDLSADEMSESMLRRCQDVVNDCTTFTRLTARFRPVREWMSPGVVGSTRKRAKMYKKILQKLLRRAKREYYAKKIEEAANDTRKTWSVINSIFRGKQTGPAAGPELIGLSIDEINENFAELGKKTVLDNIGEVDPNMKPPSPADHSMNEFKHPDESEVERVLRELNVNEAPGWDGIGADILKNCYQSLKAPITSMVCRIFETSTYPRSLKRALLFPVHKSGDRTNISNYRPISLLPTLNKVVEKIMANRLREYLEEFGIIDEKQFGFRTGRGSEEAVYEITKCISESIESGDYCVAVFCDLSKAFDTLDRSRLKNKLDRAGVRGRALDLLTSYLCERTQIYRSANETSKETLVKCGVPQGSVLGPLLFNIYMNDVFTTASPHRVMAFADDTVLVIRDTDMISVCLEAEICRTGRSPNGWRLMV